MKNNNCGIIEIRPRIVFEKVESTFPNQDVNFVVKIKYDDGVVIYRRISKLDYIKKVTN